MAWPQSQDYNEAIQNTKSCFKDAELSKGQAVTNPLGMPLPCSGNFADVYQVHCPQTNTRWAVKCFTRGDPASLRQRYAQIDEHLQQARLPFTVGFRYLEEGIRIRNQWHPVLKMQWVEGFTLNHFIRDNLDKPNLLEALLQIWVRMAKRLREADMAHADLQHGNVLLVPGNTASSLSVKLIDYDGMWVPALAGQKSGEVGHPAYQHTKRLYEGTYSKEVDRFPLLVVATALRCLRVVGRPLWEKFDNGDNLLFREADLAAPERSPLFAELEKIQDAQVQLLVEAVRQGCNQPLEDAPFLDTLLPEALPAKKAAAAITSSVPPAPAKTKAAAKSDIQPQPEPASAFAYLGEASSDAETSAGTRRKRDSDPAAAPDWKKWAIIGGSGGAALLALVLVLALSGGQKDQKEKPDDRQVSNRDDSKKNTDDKGNPTQRDKPEKKDKKDKETRGKGARDKPGDPAPRQVVLKVPVSVHMTPGKFMTVGIVLEGARGLDTQMQLENLPPGVTADADGINAETGTHGWKVTVGADVPAGVYPITVVASVGKERLERKFPLSVARPGGDVKPPEPGDAVKIVASLTTSTGASCQSLGFSPDGRLVLGQGDPTSMVIWDTDKMRPPNSLQNPNLPMTACVFLSDGRQAVSAGLDRSIYLHQVRELQHQALGKHAARIMALAVSRDGKRAVSTSGNMLLEDGKPVIKDDQSVWEDLTLKVWDLLGRKELRQISNLPGPVTSLSLSGDGKRALGLSTVNRQGCLILWDLETGQEIGRPLSPLTIGVMSHRLSADGKTAAIAQGDRFISFWDLESGKQLRRIGPLPEPHRHITLSSDDRFLLSGGTPLRLAKGEFNKECTARLWEVATGREVARMDHPQPITAVTLSPDGSRAATSCKDGTLRVFDLKRDVVKVPPPNPGATGKAKVLHKIEGDGPFFGASFSPDGSWIVAYTEKFKHMVNAKTGAKVWTQGTFTVGGMTRAEWVDNDNVLFADNVEVVIRQRESGGNVRTFKIANPQPTGLAVSADGRRGVVVFRDASFRILDLEKGKIPFHISGAMPGSRQMAFSQDGSKLLLASPQPHFRRLVLNTQTGKEICELRGTYSEPDLRSVACTFEGKRGALGFAGGKVLLWDLENNKEASESDKRLAGHSAPVHSCAFSADGRFVLTGAGALPDKDCTARLWETATGREVLRLEGHTAPVTVVALSRDNRQALTVSQKTIRIWDLGTVGASE